MKPQRLLALGGLAVVVAAPACSRYGALKEAWQGYEPTPFYAANAVPAEAPPFVASAAPSDAPFRAALEELQAAKARWEKSLSEDALSAGSFYRPDPARAAALQGAARDAKAAEKALAGGYTLADLEILALFRNRGVAAAGREVRAALERYSEASNLDEVLRQYTAFTEASMTGVGPMKGREPVEMSFPFPGMLALKGEIVTQEVEAELQSLEIARRTAITGVRKAYWNLLFVRQARAITAQMLDLLQRLEAVATTRYESGKTSFQDVIKVRINRETLQEEVATLAEKEGNVVAKLRELVDLPPDAPVGAPAAGEPDGAVPEQAPLYRLALQRKQEILRMEAMVGKMERMIEMAESRVYPGFSLNLSLFQDEAVNQVGSARMKEPFAVETAASMGAGVPKMPWYGTNDAYLRETKEKVAALREDLAKARNMTVFAVRDAWSQLDQASREENLYRAKVVSLSKAALEVSTQGYQAGKVMFADVIASHQDWLKHSLALERRRSDLGVARAELEAAVGVSPLGR